MGDKTKREALAGLSTLSCRITANYLGQIIDAIRRLRLTGMPENEILTHMHQELTALDRHTIGRIHARSMGDVVLDDFPADAIVSEDRPKSNTVVLVLKELPADIGPNSLVQHGGREYVVAGVTAENKLTLKLVE